MGKKLPAAPVNEYLVYKDEVNGIVLGVSETFIVKKVQCVGKKSIRFEGYDYNGFQSAVKYCTALKLSFQEYSCTNEDQRQKWLQYTNNLLLNQTKPTICTSTLREERAHDELSKRLTRLQEFNCTTQQNLSERLAKLKGVSDKPVSYDQLSDRLGALQQMSEDVKRPYVRDADPEIQGLLNRAIDELHLDGSSSSLSSSILSDDDSSDVDV